MQRDSKERQAKTFAEKRSAAGDEDGRSHMS